ncbi:hypothetical protein A2773_05230 [Candidatus Gottesmanbacteria bacterium RIFCSPHIGHO2_01_FULL_39_10]|uniref:Resolvase HTH domain-containing protein n=1 Tax=Candidatus Gottesmanbacteria bacterium RIFCSPHIGHO2_01_FULL_39_10 TaxID=1798375 RepID=A0A1F5ZP71_9BACT|nr:MAG: hypothetical protein A2773_05230 [Candidatus Gottesmanbacteria bacterium RIFCSPHIGHO2_01_FULL_39_10]
MKGKAVDNKTREKIVYLRKHGYSLPEISILTKIPKTTAFRYLQGVQVLPEYRTAWLGKRGGSRKRMYLKEKAAYEEGVKFVQSLSIRDKLLFLSALYWAEGSKKDFGLSNTDPDLIKVFVSILRDVLGISVHALRVSVRIYEDLDKEKCLDFWSNIVGIPKEKFVNVNILKGKKKGKLEYGMCRVRILKGGDILKKIKGINRAVKENFAPIA